MSKEIELRDIHSLILKTASVKKVSMPLEIYNKELELHHYNGQKLIMEAVLDIINTGGKNITLKNGASEEIKEFLKLVSEKVSK